MRLQLHLDSYLSKFNTLVAAQNILDAYYSNDVYLAPIDNYEQKVKDKYYIAYQLLKITETSISFKDAWFALNLSYALKGATVAVSKFCEFLGLTCKITTNSDNTILTLVGNLSVLSINSFIVYLQQLIKELLFINQDDSTIKIDDIIINYDITFTSTINLSQTFINQNKTDTILRE